MVAKAAFRWLRRANPSQKRPCKICSILRICPLMAVREQLNSCRWQGTCKDGPENPTGLAWLESSLQQKENNPSQLSATVPQTQLRSMTLGGPLFASFNLDQRR